MQFEDKSDETGAFMMHHNYYHCLKVALRRELFGELIVVTGDSYYLIPTTYYLSPTTYYLSLG